MEQLWEFSSCKLASLTGGDSDCEYEYRNLLKQALQSLCNQDAHAFGRLPFASPTLASLEVARRDLAAISEAFQYNDICGVAVTTCFDRVNDDRVHDYQAMEQLRCIHHLVHIGIAVGRMIDVQRMGPTAVESKNRFVNKARQMIEDSGSSTDFAKDMLSGLMATKSGVDERLALFLADFQGYLKHDEATTQYLRYDRTMSRRDKSTWPTSSWSGNVKLCREALVQFHVYDVEDGDVLDKTTEFIGQYGGPNCLTRVTIALMQDLSAEDARKRNLPAHEQIEVARQRVAKVVGYLRHKDEKKYYQSLIRVLEDMEGPSMDLVMSAKRKLVAGLAFRYGGDMRLWVAERDAKTWRMPEAYYRDIVSNLEESGTFDVRDV